MDEVDRTRKLSTSSASGLMPDSEKNDTTLSSTNTSICQTESFINYHVPPIVPTGLKIVALVSMTTAVILIGVSGILLSKTQETLFKWIKAAPTTMNLLSQVNNLLGGTTGIVEEVELLEQYLRILYICSAILVGTGIMQLLCNFWFFCRMNASCISHCMSKSEQFCCGI